VGKRERYVKWCTMIVDNSDVIVYSLMSEVTDTATDAS
jgi:hypothetical protein